VGLTLGYVVRRLGLFVLIVWITATINFLVPRLAPGDPMGAVIGRMESQGQKIDNAGEIIAEYRRFFGLDEPLPIQYVKYLGALTRLEFGYSLASFPAKATDIVARALPWTLGLLATTTLLAFAVGSTLGALLAWPHAPRLVRGLVPVAMVLAAIPPYLKAILLLFLLAFTFPLFPAFGTSQIGKVGAEAFDNFLDALYHSALPALAILLSGIGTWALGMRGMMISTVGSDYLMLAEAKGLPPARIFFRYGMRNAILPQVTALAIALGHIVTGTALVEIMFSYPGVGLLLYRSITDNDFVMIQAITFMLVLAVATMALLIDLLYPRLDPRIGYARR
jgi:peptide/nickel transport system permease protein